MTSTGRVLVTGAAGFVGSNLIRHFADDGWTVVGVDDLSNGHLEFVDPRVPIVRADFSSDFVLSLIKEKRYDAVVHLAANPRVPWSVEHPVESNDVNVQRTLKLIDACVGNTGRLVFASSSAVYGTANEFPTSVHCRTDPLSPYALQKLIVEKYIRLYRKLKGLDGVSLRLFNVYGPHQIGGSPYSTVVSAWLDSIVTQRSCIRYDGDGTQLRDMVHVDDVCRAFMAAVSHAYEKTEPDTFNVGTGVCLSNKEVLDLFIERYGSKDIPVPRGLGDIGPEMSMRRIGGRDLTLAPARLGDAKKTLAKILETTMFLGWTPSIEFRQGLSQTCDWYEKNREMITRLVQRY